MATTEDMNMYPELDKFKSTGEYFKPISGYSRYFISNLGRVVSTKRAPKLLSVSVNKAGYYRVTLSKGYSESYELHALMAMVFLPNPDPSIYSAVRHKDNNKLNNSLDNLYWITPEESKAMHKVNCEKSMAKHYTFLSPEGDTVEVFNLAEFCRGTPLEQTAMSKVHLGKAEHHKGWTKA